MCVYILFIYFGCILCPFQSKKIHITCEGFFFFLEKFEMSLECPIQLPLN